MRGGIFGWDYPPGCSGPPDDDGICYICGEDTDNCICPECPICESVGDPDCYINHGLKRTWEQKFSLECTNRYWDLESWKESLRISAMDKAYAEEEIIPYNPGEFEDYSEQADEYWKQQEREYQKNPY